MDDFTKGMFVGIAGLAVLMIVIGLIGIVLFDQQFVGI